MFLIEPYVFIYQMMNLRLKIQIQNQPILIQHRNNLDDKLTHPLEFQDTLMLKISLHKSGISISKISLLGDYVS